jgi:hypothetical protein
MAVIPHTPHSPDLAPCDFFLFPKMKLKLKGGWFYTIEKIQDELQKVLDSMTEKGFPGSIPKMKEMVGPGSTCRRELLRGSLQPIGLMVSFMIFTGSVQNILDTPLYDRAISGCYDLQYPVLYECALFVLVLALSETSRWNTSST